MVTWKNRYLVTGESYFIKYVATIRISYTAPKGANRCYLWQMITKFFICMCANRFITKLSINAFISLKKFGSALKGQIFIWTPTEYFYHKSGLSCACVTSSSVGFTVMVGDTIIALYLSSNSPTSNSCSLSALTDGGQACLAHAHRTCAICYIHQSTTKIDNNMVHKSSIVGSDPRSILWIKYVHSAC